MPPKIECWRVTPEYMQRIADPVADVFRAVEDEILVNIARQFKAQPKQTASFDWQAKKLGQLGRITRQNAQIIAKRIGDERGLTRVAIENTLLKAINSVEPELSKGAAAGLLDGKPQPVSDTVAQELADYEAQAIDRQNLVNTAMLNSSLDQYRRVVINTAEYEQQLEAAQLSLNRRTGEVVTGVSTHQQAVRKAIKDMAATGLTGFVDRAGREWTAEAYVNMDIRTTAHNAATQAVFRRCDEYECNLVEVSSHPGARPRCEPFQGRLFDRGNGSGYTKDVDGHLIPYAPWSSTSYGEAAGLLGINCGHSIYPFIPGLSKQTFRPYPQEENEKVYKEQQKQRQLERNIREAKREAACLRAAGDEEGAQKAAQKVRQRQSTLAQFCEDTGRTRRRDREQVYGFDPQKPPKKRRKTPAAQPEAPAKKPEETEQVDEDFDIFKYFEEEDETPLKQIKRSDVYGQNGLDESEYTKDLRLTEAEKKRVKNVRRFFDGERLKKSEEPSNYEIDAFNGLLTKPAIEDYRAQQRGKASEAEKMIRQRKAEGYKGKSRAESYADYRHLKEQLVGADEFEAGAILNANAVGESGIRYWQIQRKDAERNMTLLDFAEKIILRREYAKTKTD